jgi:hypothetical protein
MVVGEGWAEAEEFALGLVVDTMPTRLKISRLVACHIDWHEAV